MRERDTKTTAGGTFHYKGQCWHMTAQEDRHVPMEHCDFMEKVEEAKEEGSLVEEPR